MTPGTFVLALEEREAVIAHRRELLSELPESYDEFLSDFEKVSKDDWEDIPEQIYRAAEGLGVLRYCSICGAPVVDDEELAQAILDYYGTGDHGSTELETAIMHSGADVGADLCSYHQYVMNKDD